MINNDKQDAITTILSAFGITISIQDIQEIISIILLVLSIINILWVLGSRLYSHIKHKDYDKISNDIQDATEKLKDLKGGEDNEK